MSETPPSGFARFVPGFDFLQGLAKGAAQNIPQLPNLGNWVAPTLSVEELGKRIGELRAVQFWLEQNARALGATIQALEVQKMTLSTLQGMNFDMGDVANALTLRTAGGAQKVRGKAAAGAAGTVAGVAGTARRSGTRKGARAKPKSAAGAHGGTRADAGVVDPLQWWGALTQQFQEIAANAMKDAAQKTAADAARPMATGEAGEAAQAAAGAARKSAPRKAASPRRGAAGG